jgi:hypothetical protein
MPILDLTAIVIAGLIIIDAAWEFLKRCGR